MSGGHVLTEATLGKLVDTFGAEPEPVWTTYDVAVIGLGPAGFSAALNAAAEGLHVVMIEPSFSQASESPMIRNYLGFPSGISGAELLRRAWYQALLFGATFRIGRTASGIRDAGDIKLVHLDDGSELATRAVILATGVEYRRLGIPSVDGLVGRGVFYGYGALEAQAMDRLAVGLVGGGNSAAQASIHLARYSSEVILIVRGHSLEASEYLVDQVHGLTNVEVMLDTEVLGAGDAQQLHSITLRDRSTGATTTRDVGGLFILIGSVPRTDWLPDSLALDERGFILTGADRPSGTTGPLELPYESSIPGIFAIGDARSGSVKRVAAAVGEGSAVTQQLFSGANGRLDTSRPWLGRARDASMNLTTLERTVGR
jgi:thioredoxin reductase (NADPH)